MDLNQVLESGVLDSKKSEWVKFEKGKDSQKTFRMIGGVVVVDSYYYNDGDFRTSVNYPKGQVPHKLLKGIEPKFRAMVQIVEKTEDGEELKKYGMPKSVLRGILELKTTKGWEYDVLPDYDIVIKKTGAGIETRYSVTPSPNKDPLSKEVLKEFKDSQSIEDFVDESVKKDLNKILEHKGLEIIEPVKDEEIDLDDLPF